MTDFFTANYVALAHPETMKMTPHPPSYLGHPLPMGEGGGPAKRESRVRVFFRAASLKKTAFMHGRSQRGDTQRASARGRRDWPRTAFIGSILLLSVSWVSTPCLSARTDTKSGSDPYSQGVLLLTQQKWKQAAAEFQQAIHNDPKNSQAHCGLGVALTRLGNRKEAEAAFSDAIRLDANNVQAHYYLGLIAAESQDLEVATRELKTAVELKPDFEEARLALALAMEERGQIKEAIGEYQTVLKRNPKSAEAHNGLGNAYVQNNEISRGIEEYRRAVELKPDYFRAYNNLGSTLASVGDFDAGYAAIRKALALRPESFEAHLNMGLIMRAKGDPKGAIAQFERVLALHPPDAVAYRTEYEKAQTYQQMGDLEEALQCLVASLRFAQQMGEAYYSLGSVLKQLASSKPPQASPAPANPDAQQFFDQGSRKLAEGDLEGAAQALDAALEADPGYAKAHNLLGFVLGQQGKLPEAIKELHQAVALDPQSSAAHSISALPYGTGAREPRPSPN